MARAEVPGMEERIMKLSALSAGVLVLTLSSAAWAQGGGGFGQGRDFDGNRISWYSSLDRALSGQPEDRGGFGAPREPEPKKWIFVYVRPATEQKDPNEFQNSDLASASRGAWAFVRMDFNKDNPNLKTWGVKGAPMCLGCDKFGNEFVKVAGTPLDQLRRIISGTPELIARYEQKLAAEYQKAVNVLKTDEPKGVKLLIDLIASAKPGYKQIADAQAKLNEQAEPAFKRAELAESVGPDAAIESYAGIARTYAGTGAGIRAEIRVARLEHARGNVQLALQKLTAMSLLDPKVYKLEIEQARREMDEINRAGDTKLAQALNNPDKAAGREAIQKIAKDYAGTEAGKRAAEALRRAQ